jgi:hypothetical protein
VNSSSSTRSNAPRHRGPHPGFVAVVFVVLFLAGLYPVTMFGGSPYFPGPWETPDVIATFFRLRPESLVLCAFFHFGASVTLGIFAATIVSQLSFLGVRVAGTNIAFFGGLMTAFNMAASAYVLWTGARPGIAEDPMLVNALYYLSYVLGGPGFSAPFGLLMAGVSIPAGIFRLVPTWIAILGLVLAVLGELSSLNLVFSWALPLIPLTRFPGFIWIILIGFGLPRSRKPLEDLEPAKRHQTGMRE